MLHTFEERVYGAWLASGLIPTNLFEQVLLNCYDSCADVYAAFQAGESQLMQQLPEHLILRLKQTGAEYRMQTFERSLQDNRIQTVTRFERDRYPRRLSALTDPPNLLFYQGELNCADREKTLSFVGSRRVSYMGLNAAKTLAEGVSRAGVTVISGLAYGIDTASHEGCLAGGSPTVAVMGCGLDRVYPAGNEKLKQRILAEGGLFLSEFAPGESPLGWHFPVRNRIISGLSEATVLVEARLRSGSLTTVDHALTQGKEVFVYPGDPNSEKFEGNHFLLRDGARYFTTAEDILEDMGWLDKNVKIAQNNESALASAVSEEERKVIQALSAGEMSFEQLCVETGLPPAKLMTALTMLQIHGTIEPQPGKMYRLGK